MPSNPPSAPDPYRHPTQYADYERAHGRQPPAWTDGTVESTSRLRAENEELLRKWHEMGQSNAKWQAAAVAAEATMRDVAEVLRQLTSAEAHRLADRLDPPPVVEKPLHAYFPSDVDAGSRSPCVHCGQAYDAHVPPPVVENPPAEGAKR